MQKDLRSLIQEVIPMQLRVDLVVLSKRRDLGNKEKMDKLLNLLRDYGIHDVVQLGLGTNRYGFKIGWFVCKYALDKHGAVDNLNEFIYAKRVYPNGIKIHEVMENGILCICEYIQPFSSFSEMLFYKEKIRKILKDLSSYYLIGDVGLEAKNYANWGLRSGTDDPVMLDYAYIYDVKSEIFVCRQKGCGGVLIPDDDYTYLYCNRCKTKRSFASLRDMIKNTDQTDLFHNLSKYGYEMEQAHETVTLDPSRSIYLQRQVRKSKYQIEETQAPKEIDFSYNPEEETDMDGKRIINIITDENEIRKAKLLPIQVFKTENEDEDDIDSVIDEVENEEDQIPDDVDDYGDDINNSDEDVEVEDSEEVVYTYHMQDDNTPEETSKGVWNVAEVGEKSSDEDERNAISDDTEEVVVVTLETKSEEIVNDNTAPKTPVIAKEVSEAPRSSKLQAGGIVLKYFEKNIGFCISKCSNYIRDYFMNRSQNNLGDDLFELVSGDIKSRRMLRDEFYSKLSHSAFKAFRLFLHLKDKDPNSQRHDSNSLMFEDGFLDNPEEKEYYPTMIFLYRWFNDISLNEKSAKIGLKEYKDIYSDYTGIQKKWLDFFKSAFIKKVNISDVGAIIVSNEIEAEWCAADPEIINEPESEDASIEETSTQETITGDGEGEYLPPMPDTSDIDQVNKELLEIIESGSESSNDDDIDAEDTDDDNDEEVDDEDEEDIGISVSIFDNSDGMLFDGLYITSITDDSDKVDVAIPIYGNINNVDPNAEPFNTHSWKNGYWDWMSNFMTDLYFETTNPDKYMKFNTEEGEYKFVIVFVKQNGAAVIGIYPYSGIILHQGNRELDVSTDPTYLNKVNKFIIDAIGTTNVSIRQFHQNIPEVMMTSEAEIAELFDYEINEGEDEEEENSVIDSDAMQAAIDFAKRNNPNTAKANDDILPVIHRK